MTEEITVICLLCGYEGSAHEAGSPQCIVDTLTKIKDAKADTNRLAEALEHTLTDYDLSYVALPGMCDFADREAVMDARKALDKHNARKTNDPDST